MQPLPLHCCWNSKWREGKREKLFLSLFIYMWCRIWTAQWMHNIRTIDLVSTHRCFLLTCTIPVWSNKEKVVNLYYKKKILDTIIYQPTLLDGNECDYLWLIMNLIWYFARCPIQVRRPGSWLVDINPEYRKKRIARLVASCPSCPRLEKKYPARRWLLRVDV